MRVQETSKKEIETRFNSMGDYVRIDYLRSCLKNHLDFDTRKYVLVKLAGLFEERKMYVDAGKAMKTAAEINTTYQNKINDFSKSAQFFIMGGDYEAADASIMRALGLANSVQKAEIKEGIKEFYKTQGNFFSQSKKRNQAMLIFERLLRMDLTEDEKLEVRNILLDLYQQLGKMNEYNVLKRKH